MKISEKERQAIDSIVARASVDWSFRQQLLVNPHEAIHRAFGVRIPENYRLRFIERGEDVDALIVLPDFRAPGDELTPRDLEVVTGGTEEEPSWSDSILEVEDEL